MRRLAPLLPIVLTACTAGVTDHQIPLYEAGPAPVYDASLDAGDAGDAPADGMVDAPQEAASDAGDAGHDAPADGTSDAPADAPEGG
jgi:hypothetical protein